MFGRSELLCSGVHGRGRNVGSSEQVFEGNSVFIQSQENRGMCSRQRMTHWSLNPRGLRRKPGTCSLPPPFLPVLTWTLTMSPGFLYTLDLLPLLPQESLLFLNFLPVKVLCHCRHGEVVRDCVPHSWHIHSGPLNEGIHSLVNWEHAWAPLPSFALSTLPETGIRLLQARAL